MRLKSYHRLEDISFGGGGWNLEKLRLWLSNSDSTIFITVPLPSIGISRRHVLTNFGMKLGHLTQELSVRDLLAIDERFKVAFNWQMLCLSKLYPQSSPSRRAIIRMLEANSSHRHTCWNFSNRFKTDTFRLCLAQTSPFRWLCNYSVLFVRGIDSHRDWKTSADSRPHEHFSPTSLCVSDYTVYTFFLTLCFLRLYNTA